eukprot:SAG22_NODE_15963_length_336_cov_0.426160_1_plen_23_part_10
MASGQLPGCETYGSFIAAGSINA